MIVINYFVKSCGANNETLREWGQKCREVDSKKNSIKTQNWTNIVNRHKNQYKIRGRSNGFCIEGRFELEI